jgi:hypothetical protein
VSASRQTPPPLEVLLRVHRELAEDGRRWLRDLLAALGVHCIDDSLEDVGGGR